MKERGIIFPGESVRAIRAGTKTQTRRVLRFTEVLSGVARVLPSSGRG